MILTIFANRHAEIVLVDSEPVPDGHGRRTPAARPRHRRRKDSSNTRFQRPGIQAARKRKE